MKISIGLRLGLLYWAIFLLAQVILGTGTWLVVRQNLFTIADTALDDQASDLQRLLEPQKDAPAAQLQAAIAAHFNLERSRDYVQIGDATSNSIYRSRFFSEHPFPPYSPDDLDRPIYENRKLGQDRFRFLSKQLEVNGHVYIVRVGHPMREESATLNALRAYLLWCAPILLLAASVAAYWLSRRTTRPAKLPEPHDGP